MTEDMTVPEAVIILTNYNKWRSGEDERTMDEAGIVPHVITVAIDTVLAYVLCSNP